MRSLNRICKRHVSNLLINILHTFLPALSMASGWRSSKVIWKLWPTTFTLRVECGTANERDAALPIKDPLSASKGGLNELFYIKINNATYLNLAYRQQAEWALLFRIVCWYDVECLESVHKLPHLLRTLSQDAEFDALHAIVLWTGHRIRIVVYRHRRHIDTIIIFFKALECVSPHGNAFDFINNIVENTYFVHFGFIMF